MGKRKLAARLHMLSVREVIAADMGDHNDGGGLLLRVQTDRASWVFRYTAATGRRREMGVGACQRQSAAMAGESLRQAREKAAQARAMLDEVPPRDPIDERARARAEAAEAERRAVAERRTRGESLARVARAYHEKYIEPKLSTAQSARWIGSLAIHVPADLWAKPIEAVTRAELLDFLLGMQSEFADTAHRVRRRLDEIYDDAIDRGLVSENPVGLLRNKLRRHRVSRRVVPRASLPYAEVTAFVHRLRGQSGVAARCLEFVILTAARTGEAIGATWDEIDLPGALWTVPAERMKGGQAHAVPLSPRAVEILNEMQALGSPWVFPSPQKQTRPMSNMGMLAMLKRMNRTDITVHGFRATFSTWANETDTGRPDVIEACLAHRENDRIRAAYNRATFAVDRRKLLLAWAQFVETGNQPGTVVELRGARAA